MYLAIINVPGYMPEGEPTEHETATQAWQHLFEERLRDLGDPMSDESDSDIDADNALDEMDGREDIGTVYGYTPGRNDYTHDLGLAYSVIRQDGGGRS